MEAYRIFGPCLYQTLISVFGAEMAPYTRNNPTSFECFVGFSWHDFLFECFRVRWWVQWRILSMKYGPMSFFFFWASPSWRHFHKATLVFLFWKTLSGQAGRVKLQKFSSYRIIYDCAMWQADFSEHAQNVACWKTANVLCTWGKKHFNINRKHLSMFSLTSCNLKLKIAAYNQTIRRSGGWGVQQSAGRSPAWHHCWCNESVCCWILSSAGSDTCRGRSAVCIDGRAAHVQKPTETCHAQTCTHIDTQTQCVSSV